MWLTDLAVLARKKADQAALTSAADISQCQLAIVADIFLRLGEMPSFVDLLTAHGLTPRVAGHSPREARSETSEGTAILEFTILRGCVTRLLSHADIVNWMARHEPIHLRTFQNVIEIDSLPQANAYRARRPKAPLKRGRR